METENRSATPHGISSVLDQLELLTEDALASVRAAAGPERWDRGRRLLDAVDIWNVEDFRISADVAGRGGDYRVYVSLGSLTCSCSCPDSRRWCKHGVATVLDAVARRDALLAAAAQLRPADRGPSSSSTPTDDLGEVHGPRDPRDPVALHVVWDPEEPLELAVWAETTAYAEHSPGRRGRRPKAAKPHPYAADPLDVAAVLDADPAVASLPAETAFIDVTLEATSRIPYPSDAAIAAGRPRPRGTLRPALYTVPALVFTGGGVPEVAESLALALGTQVPVETGGHALVDIVAAATDALRPAPACYEWRTELHVTLEGSETSDDEAPGQETWAVSMRMRGADGRTLELAEIRAGFPDLSHFAAYNAALGAHKALRRRSPGLGHLGRLDGDPVAEVTVSTDTFLELLAAQDTLAEADVDVLVPEGLKTLTSMHVGVTAIPFEAGRFGLDALCAFQYTIDADGHSIDPSALASAAALDRRLLPTPDGLVVLTRSQAAAIRRALSASTVLDALTLQGFDDGVEVDAVEGVGWLGQLLDAGPTAVDTVDVGTEFAGTLLEHQQLAVDRFSFLADHGLGGLLFDEMGLGKTVMGLALTAADHHRGTATGPTLVVAPTGVSSVWSKEAARFCPHLGCTVIPDSKTDPAVAVAAGADIVVTTPTKVRLNAAAYSAVRWHRVIVDEAHVAKNPASKTHAALRSLDCGQMIVATGTPVQNGLDDLHAVTTLAVPGLLGGAKAFGSQFARPIRDGHMDADRLCEAVLGRISPFMVMRSKPDVGLDDDLPPAVVTDEVVELTAEQQLLLARSAEAAVQKAARAESMWGRNSAALEGVVRAKQICNHPENLLRTGRPLDGRSNKYERLIELADGFIAVGEKTLVFTQYRVMAELLHDGLGARYGAGRVGVIHGGVTAAERATFAGRLERDELDLVVLTVGAGGVGLTLNAANHVVHYDRWWNPAVEDQATARCHRIGQTRQVTVHRLMCNNSIEMLIAETLDEKRAVASRLFNASGDNAMARHLAKLDDDALYKALTGIASVPTFVD